MIRGSSPLPSSQRYPLRGPAPASFFFWELISLGKIFWSHQTMAFRYTLHVSHPALFMEMRLGKNLVTIRRIKMYRPRNGQQLRILISAPGSAIEAWIEALRDEGETSIGLLLGSREKRLAALCGAYKWFIINHAGHRVVPDIAREKWDCVVLDESTVIKNPKTRVSAFYVNHFRNVPHRWALTGIPNPESPLDVFSQMAWLHGSFLGCRSFWDYRARNFTRSSYDWALKPGVQGQMDRELGRRAFVMRREDVGMTVREVTECCWVDMPKKVRKEYDKIEQDFETSSGQQTIWAGERYVWLRRLCGGFLDGRLIWDGKVKEFIRLMENELKGQPVVVWFVFNDELELIRRVCSRLGISHHYLRGSVPLEERRRRERDFRHGKVQILLLQQAVAQTGMDLSRADTCIYYSEPVGLFANVETRDRIVNLSKTSTVLYIYLLTRGTVDADVHTLTHAKAWRSQLDLSRALAEQMQARRLLYE